MGRLTVAVHTSPPLQPPSRQELAPGLTEKSQLRRALEYNPVRNRPMTTKNYGSTQIRPAVQLSATANETSELEGASHLSHIHLGEASDVEASSKLTL